MIIAMRFIMLATIALLAGPSRAAVAVAGAPPPHGHLRAETSTAAKDGPPVGPAASKEGAGQRRDGTESPSSGSASAGGGGGIIANKEIIAGQGVEQEEEPPPRVAEPLDQGIYRKF